MFNLKQFWFILLKWSLVILLSAYLIVQLQADNQNFKKVFQVLLLQFEKQPYLILFLFLLSGLNWILEIKKWQILIRKIRSISFWEATKQTLSSHSFSLVTPFKSGDYAFKTLFFEKDKKIKVLALNALGNLVQLSNTLLMGFLGWMILSLFYVVNNPIESKQMRLFGILALLLIGITFVVLKKQPYFKQIIHKFKIVNREKLYKIGLISFLRYVIFSHQFYFILLIFGLTFPYAQVISLIFLTYFLSSILPVFTLFDFVIKGSAALLIFSKLGVSESILFTTTTLMWFMNFVLPAMIGVLVMLTLKSDQIALKPKQK